MHDQQLGDVVQHKIMKVNGQIGYKKYQRGKLLGKGGFAKCYEGTNLETKKMYAIKVIDKVSLQKNRAKQKLLSEIKIHKTLHQLYIVEFDSVFEDSNFVYIILELCVNKTLSEMVKKRKRLTVKEAKFYMMQLILAVEYMHSNRVIHRDLKLGNIFLSFNMEMKVGDFGLAAKLQFAEEKKRTMCGTPNYIAPEIVEGSVGHSYEVDIWSMGVICYAFLFGRPPFQTNQVKMTYKKIKSCQYAFPSTTVPEDAKDFIKKILILDPKQRMTTKQMLAHPFMMNQEVIKTLSVEALTQIPNFTDEPPQSTLSKNKSCQKLRAQDFGKKKLELNLNFNNNVGTNEKIFQGMKSPRNVFNEQYPANYQMKNQQQTQDEHKLNIITYLDYSKKYGLGYLLNNKYYGVYFNDETLMSCDQKKEIIYFVENPTLKQESIISYKKDTLPKNRDFQKKYMLLQRFVIHLNEEVEKLPQDKRQFEKDSRFVYIKQWLKTRHAIMFGLSNKLFQVNFFDNSQILLHTAKKTVLFTSKKGQKTYQILSNVLQTHDNEMARRIKYTKQILNSIKKKKDQKIDDIPDAP